MKLLLSILLFLFGLNANAAKLSDSLPGKPVLVDTIPATDGWDDGVIKMGPDLKGIVQLLKRLDPPPFEASTRVTVTYFDGQPMDIYLPENYSLYDSLPLIIYLSGQGLEGTNISVIRAQGMHKYMESIKDNNKFPAIIICPQNKSGQSEWFTTYSKPAIDYMLNNGYKVSRTQMHDIGYSLGGTGAGRLAKDYPSYIASCVIVAGTIYRNATDVEPMKSIPSSLYYGTSDNVQNVSNAWYFLDSIYTKSGVVAYPQLRQYWGVGHGSIDTTMKFFATEIFPWMMMHSKNFDTTAKRYVDSADRASIAMSEKRELMYWRAKRYVQTALPSGAHKTALLARLVDINNKNLGNGYKRVVIDCGIASKQSAGNINNWTNGATGSRLANQIDEDGNIVPNVVTKMIRQMIPGTFAVDIGDYAELFGGAPGNTFDDAFDVYDQNLAQKGQIQDSGLDNSKTYTYQFFGTAWGQSQSPSYESGLRITINGVTKILRNQNKNTNDYVEFRGVVPVNGIVNIYVESYVNDGHGYLNAIFRTQNGTQSEGSNTLPVVSAGNPITIRLPLDTVRQVGSAYDPDGSIAHVAWSKVSGPNAVFTAATSTTTTIKDLEEGDYIFKFTATDNNGGVSSSTVAITVQKAYHQYPTIQASENQTIVGSSAALLSSSTAPSGTIEETFWTIFRTATYQAMRLVLFGSSTIAGENVPMSFAKRFNAYAKPLGLIDTLINKGVPATSIFEFNASSIIALNPHIVIGQYPSNKYNDSTIASIINKTIEKDDSLRNAGIKVIWLSPQPRNEFSSLNRQKLSDLTDTMLARMPGRVINIFKPAVDSVGNYLKTELDLGDGIHGNENLHILITELVKAFNIFRPASTVNILSPHTANTNISNLPTGPITLQVSAYDQEGFPAMDTVKLDVTAPVGCGTVKDFDFDGWYIDGAARGVNPGDILMIDPGEYGFKELYNFIGTPECPIRIRKKPGGPRLTIEALNLAYPSRNVIIEGDNDPQYEYSIHLKGGAGNYWGSHLKCEGPLEMHHIEISGCQMGIQLKDDNAPPELVEHRDFKFHNLYIHDTKTNEAMYIGSSTTPKAPKVRKVHIYDVLIDSSGREGLQISNAQEVLVERVKILNPSLLNENSQNHAFNLGHDVEATVRDMYIQSSPSFNFFISGGRITANCITIEHLDRPGIPRTDAIYGKNYEFDAEDWVETYQKFTLTNIHLLNAGGVNIVSETSYGPLQANIINNVWRDNSASTPMKWGPITPAPLVTNVGTTNTLTCSPPLRNTVFAPGWPAVSPSVWPPLTPTQPRQYGYYIQPLRRVIGQKQ